MDSPLDLVLKLNEYLDIKDFIEEVMEKEQEKGAPQKGRR